MDVPALAKLEHSNMIAALVAGGSQVRGARVERADGVALIATGLPLRLFNQVLVEDDDARPEAVAAALGVTRGRGDRFIVSLRSGTDDRFHVLMDELGLVKVSDGPWMPGMALHPLPPAGMTPVAVGHEIRRVETAAGVDDHVHAAAEGFEMPRSWLDAIVTVGLAALPGASLYVGYDDDVPVTAGLGIRTGRTIGVYNIATIPAARRRGYGAAMTMRIVDDGAAAGCDVAILQASDMGRPIYERLGFRTVVEYVGFVDPASLEPSA
ncbi:MAG: GNAT family N-acetyltransferase [Chloroflexota bacterium]|nr:GNAT family N-acetyltransferase [Chloroflexota bacterium]